MSPRPDRNAVEERYAADGGAEGLVTRHSDAGVATSVRRVTAAIEDHEALGLMAEIDHAANAATVDRELPPTTVLVSATRSSARR